MLLVMMSILYFLFLPHLFAGEAVLIATIPEADIVVNAERGFILQRVGTYSHKFNEGIIHTFVSLNDICKSSPGADVCLRTSSLIGNSIELGTILSVNNKHWSSPRYEKKDISLMMKRETDIILSDHKPGQFLSNISTNFHFFNRNFYINTPDDQLADGTLQSNDEKQVLTFDGMKNSPLIVLEQLRNHRIGLDFLKNEEINVILSSVMQSIEKVYEGADVQKLITDFTPLIISQTVNVFRRCSVDQEDSSSPPCLIISTLFVTPSSSTTDQYTAYNLFPIPTFNHSYQYIYKNLPKTLAFNELEQSVIVFDDYLSSKCTLSSIVQCSIEPIPTSISQMSCINHMFSIQSSLSNDCEVTRAVSSNSALLHIASDIWIFNNMDGDERCTTQSYRAKVQDLSIMKDLILEHVSCGKSIKCSDRRRLPSKCINKTIVTMDRKNGLYKPQTNFHVDSKPLIETTLTKYKKSMLSLPQEIQKYDDETAPLPTHLYRKFFNLILCIVLLFLSTIISLCGKYIYKKLQRQFNSVERRTNNLSDIFLGDDHQV